MVPFFFAAWLRYPTEQPMPMLQVATGCPGRSKGPAPKVVETLLIILRLCLRPLKRAFLPNRSFAMLSITIVFVKGTLAKGWFVFMVSRSS